MKIQYVLGFNNEIIPERKEERPMVKKMLCKDQKEILIGKLATLFTGVTVNDIDEVVDVIKTRLTDEAKEAKNRELLETFDGQVKILIDKGYPEAAGIYKDWFLEEYINPLRYEFETGDIIVIPERIVSIHKQMSLVKLKNKTGLQHPCINLGMLQQADGVETPNVPYLIHDVENGVATKNVSFSNCVKLFKKQGRFGLVPEEGIAIVTHKPEMFNNRYIYLLGSRFVSGSVPGLYLNDNGGLELDYVWPDSTNSKWGSASCGSRIRP
ncbi:hypothetical protein A2Z61_00475 [Candidatus Campbellbacteria bacterium RIFCSPLOWO2_02_35_12]|uniref:Uncharacterized protein n=1 Tax=Candidatus Campbellbacteria bacterium RIFCSPLOWO2_02_35_12 TaxID=1797580 RepID=A0A1F5EII6_9BACT|nr:MAG: hypothetical protein A2Z61_00475 [Candidatus Campbellbacteria bacterium RIFCSPLOWO2_02_35_12]